MTHDDRNARASETDSDPVTCLHCGLDVDAVRAGRGNQFCCSGCETVYGLIQSSGLDRYYDLRPDRGVPVPELRSDAFAWLEEVEQTQGADGFLRLRLAIQGVHCAACVWLLQELFDRSPGGIQLRINPGQGKVDIVWDPEAGDLRDYFTKANEFGYRFAPDTAEARSGAGSGLIVRLGICAAVALNVMIFGLCYYFGLDASDGRIYEVVGQASLALTTISVLVGGAVFFKATWTGLRRRIVHLDLPISIGILLAYSGSVYGHFTAGPEAAYFDTVATFVFLMLLGRWLQERVVHSNQSRLLSAEGLEKFSVRTVTDSGSTRMVSADRIRNGDELLIVPGEIVPVSGQLTSRIALLSLDWITGEAEPREAQSGDIVPAGAFNAGLTSVRVRSEQDFSQSRVHSLLSTPDARVAFEGGEQRWWSRVSSIYVALVLLLAVSGFALWSGSGTETAMRVAVSILVVTCPCAIGLALPLSRELAYLELKRNGVFVRAADLVDRALNIHKVLFDKTGTLTLGRLTLTESSERDLSSLGAMERSVLASMVAQSNHPRSRSLSLELAGVDAPHLETSLGEVTETAGKGLEWVRPEGVYRLGQWTFAAPGLDIRDGASRPALQSTPPVQATVFTRDGQVLFEANFEEELRGDVAHEVAQLRSAGLDVHILSGDEPGRVEALARKVGIDADRALGGLSPEDKATLVSKLDEHDTLMVGDGLNDVSALSAAHTSGTPAVDHPSVPGRADFYFLGGGMAAIRRLIYISRRLRSVNRAALGLASFYNVIALTLCFFGKVSPLTAAILMPLSSVSLVVMTTVAWSRVRRAEAVLEPATPKEVIDITVGTADRVPALAVTVLEETVKTGRSVAASGRTAVRSQGVGSTLSGGGR